MRVLIIVLILLAPLSAISAAIYEIATGKQDPTLYLLLVAIPGAFIGALKELKDSGLLPPARLKFSVNSSGKVKRWSRKNGETIQQVTGIVLAIRVENSDSSKVVDILDVSITPLDSEIVLHLPELREVKVGSETKWLYSIADGGWSELFNDGKQKPTKRAPDVWESARFRSIFLASSFSYISSIVHARPHAGNANR
jgi:hypothetical protein